MGRLILWCHAMAGSRGKATGPGGPDADGDLEQLGAEILELNSCDDGVDLAELMKALGSMEITSILFEGGSTLLGSLFDQGLVDKVVAFVAPKIVGGKNSLTAVGGTGVNLINEAIDIRVTEMKWLGTDMVIEGYPGGGRV